MNGVNPPPRTADGGRRIEKAYTLYTNTAFTLIELNVPHRRGDDRSELIYEMPRVPL